MTEGQHAAAGSGRDRVSALSPRQRRRLYAQALLRPVLTAALLVVGYFLLPLDHTGEGPTLLLLVGGVTLVVGVGAWQVWQILRSDYPLMQAIEALAAVLPAYLLAFAASYVLMSGAERASFSEPLTHMSSLYFAVVVFSTVGFGDITAQTDLTRAVVTAQIVGDLILIAFGLRLVTAAVKHGQQRQAQSPQQP